MKREELGSGYFEIDLGDVDVQPKGSTNVAAVFDKAFSPSVEKLLESVHIESSPSLKLNMLAGRKSGVDKT